MKYLQWFGAGRRSAEDVSTEFAEIDPFLAGGRFTGPDAPYLVKIFNGNVNAFESAFFYAGCLSHPMIVAKFLYEDFMERRNIKRSNSDNGQ